MLCYWRDRIPAALEIFKQLAADPHPRVRLEVVRAASFYQVPEAVEIPLIAAELPGDYYLDYCKSETMKALEPYWKAAVAENRTVNVSSPAGVRFFLGKMSLEQLLELVRSGRVPREGVSSFLKKFRNLLDPKTYQSAIDLHTRAGVAA